MINGAIAAPYIPTSVARRKNVWYTVKDGNWTDPNVWISNALSYSDKISYQYPGQPTLTATPIFPQVGDDVVISHNVTYNLGGATSLTVNNLRITGSLTWDASGSRTLNILGNLQATTLTMPATVPATINLYGTDNYVDNFSGGTSSNFQYARAGDQPVMALPYRHLFLSGSGTKYQTGNVSVLGNTTVNSTLECGSYDFTANGTTSINGTMSKTGGGNVLFVGQVAFSNPGGLTFTGNPAVELRGGISFAAIVTLFNTGTGQWTFSTNNQVIGSGAGTGSTLTALFNAPLLISGAITVQISGTNGGVNTSSNADFIVAINEPFTGDNAASTLEVYASLQFQTSASTNCMASMGVFNPVPAVANNAKCSLRYNFAGDYTIPYTNLHGLFIYSTGIKRLGGHTTINKWLTVQTNTLATTNGLDLDAYNCTIVGAYNGTTGYLYKTGAGTVVFGGSVSVAASTSRIDFSGGSPDVEIRNGILLPNGGGVINFGAGLLTFSTNNQSVRYISNNLITAAITSGQVRISGNITVTRDRTGTQPFVLVLTRDLDGYSAGSTYDNRDWTEYRDAAAPMLTGVLNCNGGANTWKYNRSGDQDVKGGTYRTLEFGGSGVKKLLGNVIVNTSAGGSWSITGSASIDYNGFTITTI